jgi:glutamate racemase
MPVVGVVEPGAAMAAEVSRKRAAIVIATEATVSSHAYRDALQLYGLEAYEKACPLFVPLVEEGWVEHPVTEQVARIYLGEAMAQAPDEADVLVLACTHYPLIAPLLRRVVQDQMQIVDSAESTARLVRKILSSDSERETHPPLSRGSRMLRQGQGPRTVDMKTSLAEHRSFRFYATDSVEKFKLLATRFLGRQVDNVEHIDLGG